MTPFKRIWDDLNTEGKAKLAKDLGTSTGYLKLIANGHRAPSYKLTKKMRKATGLALKDIRPDIYGEMRA